MNKKFHARLIKDLYTAMSYVESSEMLFAAVEDIKHDEDRIDDCERLANTETILMREALDILKDLPAEIEAYISK